MAVRRFGLHPVATMHLASARNPRAIPFVCLAALLSALAGCDGEPTAPTALELVITPMTATIVVDDTLQLSAALRDSAGGVFESAFVSWASSASDIASVDRSGKVRGVAPGLAIITAGWLGVRDSAAVTVIAGVASVRLWPDSWTVVKGGKVRYRVTLEDAAGDTVERRPLWTSSDTAVARVDSLGVVRGVGVGSATIAASVGAVTGTADLTVEVVSFVTIDLGDRHTCGLTTSGDAYCWGRNLYGQLGDGTRENSRTPVLVSGGLKFMDVGASTGFSCGVTVEGRAYCWGRNYAGWLGDGSTEDSSTPVPVSGGLTFASVTPGWFYTCGLTPEGAAYCWGSNFEGALGDSTTTFRTTPVAVRGGLAFAWVTTGDSHTCGVTVDGVAYCWGGNRHGELGLGTDGGYSATPVAVSGGYTFTSLSNGADYSCGVATDGLTYCWGHNDMGMLGRGWRSYGEAEIAPVAGGIGFASVESGVFHTCGISVAGDAYCWGENWAGQLGDGTTQDRLTPALVSGGLKFASLSLGFYHTCGITADNVAYCWGEHPHPEWHFSTTPVQVVGQQ